MKTAHLKFFHSDDGEQRMPFPPTTLPAKIINTQRPIPFAELNVFGDCSFPGSHTNPGTLLELFIDGLYAVVFDDGWLAWRIVRTIPGARRCGFARAFELTAN